MTVNAACLHGCHHDVRRVHGQQVANAVALREVLADQGRVQQFFRV